jgi:hypothetical protein
MTTPPPPPPDPSSGERATPPPDPGGRPSAAAPPETSSGGTKGGIDFGSLSQGEKLVGLGAVAVLAVYIIFELITEDYFVNYVAILLAAFILGVLWLKLQRPGMTWVVPSSSLLRVAGYLLVVFGVVLFIDQMKDDIFEAPGATIAAALILYGACAVAGIGAKQLD